MEGLDAEYRDDDIMLMDSDCATVLRELRLIVRVCLGLATWDLKPELAEDMKYMEQFTSLVNSNIT